MSSQLSATTSSPRNLMSELGKNQSSKFGDANSFGKFQTKEIGSGSTSNSQISEYSSVGGTSNSVRDNTSSMSFTAELANTTTATTVTNREEEEEEEENSTIATSNNEFHPMNKYQNKNIATNFMHDNKTLYNYNYNNNNNSTYGSHGTNISSLKNNSTSSKHYVVNGVDIVEGVPLKDVFDIPRIQRTQHIDPHSEVFPDDTSLFIGDLSRHVSEDYLRELFSKFGEVEHVEIKRDKVTRNNLGYGFVTFKDRQDAEVAKRKMHGAEFGGRSIRIGWAQKNTNLFIGDLDARINAEHLKIIFKQFGPIYNDDTFVKKNGYGFVKFKHRTHAEKAKAALDGKFLTIPGTNEQTEHPIRIGWGDSNTQRNCVHVQFDSLHGAQMNLKETDFRDVFQLFGPVVKVSLPRFPDKQLKGYGFIHFEENDDGEEAAARAITTLSSGKINGVTVQCNFGKRQNQRHKRFNKPFHSNQYDDEYEDGYGNQTFRNDMNGRDNINNAVYGYMNNANITDPKIELINNGNRNVMPYTVETGGVNIGMYDTNPTLLNQTMAPFANPMVTNDMLSSLNQFNALPPGPYLAPPALYGKTLDALAAVSPNLVPFGKMPSPSPGLSPPNLPNMNNLGNMVSPPNPIKQSTSNMLLQLSGLNQFTNGNNTMLPTNLGTTTNDSLQSGMPTTNFANLMTLLPATNLSGLQSLSPNWGATNQPLNSVTSMPSITNTFTGSPLMTVNKNTNPLQSSNLYGNFPLNLNMNGLNLSPPNLPMKDTQ